MPRENSAIRHCVFSTDLGWMALAARHRTVVEIAFGRRNPQAALRALTTEGAVCEPADQEVSELIRRLQSFACGEQDDFLDVLLDLTSLTPFQRRVVNHCRRIPYGRTLSYRQLATKAGSSHAARAVGNVMASNRYPLIVPCHRVVGSAGSLGGYSAPDGLEMKRRLLRLEGSLLAVG